MTSQLSTTAAAPALPPNASYTQFAPRREFIRDQHVFSQFSLLAISGTSAIRLYSFPTTFIHSLRQFFHNNKTTTTYREDARQGFCEFSLEGRPWATAKDIKTEKLLVDLLALVFRHGFIFLSTIDYGREQDDRLALAFSKPACAPVSRAGSPQPGVSPSGPAPVPRTVRVPFAISFASSTALRVINPPLNSTPAILQTVRGAWPRGVVAEKKISETCFEFKLKGYKWFQEDTFAEDSLRHILTLLGALDTHGFKLLFSLTLTNRSRIKDLWVFTGQSNDPVLPDSPPISPEHSSLELRRRDTADGSPQGSFGSAGAGSRHIRSGSAPSPFAGSAAPINYVAHHNGTEVSLRSQTSALGSSNTTATRSLLRKPAPKMMSVTPSGSSGATVKRNAESTLGAEPIRTSLPSEVGSAENMTGVGIFRYRPMEDGLPNHRDPSVIYETNGESGGEEKASPSLTYAMHEDDPFRKDPIHTAAVRRALPTQPSPPPADAIVPGQLSRSPPRASSPSRKPGQQHATIINYDVPYPTADVARMSPGSGDRPIPVDQPRTPSPPHDTPHSSTLLSPGAFRDTAFISSTGWRSTNIPITWGGPGGDVRDSKLGDDDKSAWPSQPQMQPFIHPPSTYETPQVPGAWKMTPLAEGTDGSTTPQGFFKPGRAMDGGDPPSGYFTEQSFGRSTSPGSMTPTLWNPATGERTPERHNVSAARIANPQSPDEMIRKSEAALIGVMPDDGSQRHPPLPTTFPSQKEKQVVHRRAASGDGWVLVDVESKEPTTRQGKAQRPGVRSRSSSDPLISPSAGSASPILQSPSGRTQGALVRFDALDTPQHLPGKTPTASSTSSREKGSRFRRLLSLSSRHEREGSEDLGIGNNKSANMLRRKVRLSESDQQTAGGSSSHFRKKAPTTLDEVPETVPEVTRLPNNRRMSLDA